MTNFDEQQIIGLAAAVQALATMQSVAVKGEFNDHHAAPVFSALIHYNPESALAAYDNHIVGLSPGLNQLKALFADALDKDLAQYLLAVVTIERKLVLQPAMRQILQSQLQALGSELRQNTQDNVGYNDVFDGGFDDDDENSNNEENTRPLTELLVEENAIERFAAIYKKTASNTEPRIMVKGNHQFLQSETSANQIRALLLAALRGAAFFRHYGGKRMDFMLKRKQYLSIINRLD